MRALILYPAVVLLCLASSASVRASLIVPAFFNGISDEEILGSDEDSRPTSTKAGDRQASCPSPARTPLEKSPPAQLVLYLSTLAGADAGSMSGGSVSLSGGVTTTMAISTNNISLADSTLVVWLSRAEWLAIPLPPNASLLRPPQLI